MYEKIYGLSCVENQVLALLRQRKEEIEYIYFDCGIPLADLYNYMVLYGVRQENYNLSMRIQDVLKRLGIIKLVKKKAMNFTEAERALCVCKENEYVLVRITPQFTKESLRARGFRRDHFVYVKKSGKDYRIFNDIPEKVLLLTKTQMQNCFDGEYFSFSVKRSLQKSDKEHLWKTRKFRPEEIEKREVLEEPKGMRKLEKTDKWEEFETALEEVQDIGIKLRNLAGIYKILRYRMAEYYGKYVDTSFIREAMPQIEKIYARLEYYNLKSGTLVAQYRDLFYQLWNLDGVIMKKLGEKIRRAAW